MVSFAMHKNPMWHWNCHTYWVMYWCVCVVTKQGMPAEEHEIKPYLKLNTVSCNSSSYWASTVRLAEPHAPLIIQISILRQNPSQITTQQPLSTHNTIINQMSLHLYRVYVCKTIIQAEPSTPIYRPFSSFNCKLMLFNMYLSPLLC